MLMALTGYLTQRGNPAADGSLYLVIPNLEIRGVFAGQIMEYFQQNICKTASLLLVFDQ